MAVSARAPLTSPASQPKAPPSSPGPDDAVPLVSVGRAPAISSLYPIPLAIFPTLSVAATSVATYETGDLLRILAVVAGLTAVVFAACVVGFRLLGRDEPLARGALVAVIAVAWFFYYIPFQEFVGGFARPLGRSVVLGPVWILASATLLWLAVRRRWTLGGAGKFLTLAGTLLVGLSAVRVTQANLGARTRALRSETMRRLSAPTPVRPGFVPAVKRDIYLIVLDGYPNAAVLSNRFGYDNTPFLDSLRTLGFTIPRHNRSNYTYTNLSVSSLLNYDHVVSLARDLRPNDKDHTIATTLIRDNRAARFLRERGYRYLLFPTEWYEATRHSPIADYTYPGPKHTSLVTAIVAARQSSELRRVIVSSTLLSKLPALQRGFPGFGGRFVLDAFQHLREVPARPEPTFTFAHFLLPHQPIVLDGECRPLNSVGEVIGDHVGLPGPRPAFLGAIRCANTQVLATVTELLKRSSVPPIIMVLGDHGTLSRGWSVHNRLPVDSVAAERLGAFAAFYMPDGGGAMFADSSTNVNVFRNVLRYYFGADLPPVSNEGFYSQAGEGFMFRPVDERAVIGG
jgi:hypothetical protein